MKLLVLASLAFTLTSAHAGFFGRIDHYRHLETGEVVEIGSNEIKEDGSVKYYSRKERVWKTTDITAFSKNTDTEIADVKQGEFLLAETGNGLALCQVWYLFENKSASIGCRTGKPSEIIGMARPAIANYNLSTVEHSGVIAEVSSLRGFSRGQTAELLVDTDENESGATVRVEAVFANGEALIQKKGLNLLDTSGLLIKYSVEKVSLNNLRKK